MKKLLDATKKSGNTKIRKTGNDAKLFGKPVRMAQLSMMPNAILCAGSKAAGCMDDCLKEAGLAVVYKSVNESRQHKTDYFQSQPEKFKAQLIRELTNFSKLCKKQGVQGVVRLNVLSDIAWEEIGIPQLFPELFFYDYTKRVKRIGKTPTNYKLMFSYSGKASYRKQVEAAYNKDVPIAVVFRGEFPKRFLGRQVVKGDLSDLINVQSGKVVVGLKAKGPAKKNDNGFVVDANSRLIAMAGR
tara:strand:+ start:145 stop:873 length:729 start_codon:yes stop_codon:yes gene_type:complete